jgi:hypothetical protein
MWFEEDMQFRFAMKFGDRQEIGNEARGLRARTLAQVSWGSALDDSRALTDRGEKTDMVYDCRFTTAANGRPWHP